MPPTEQIQPSDALQTYMIELPEPLDPTSSEDVQKAAELLLSTLGATQERATELQENIEQKQAELDGKQAQIDGLRTELAADGNPFTGKSNEEIAAMIDKQAKADFRGVIEALRDATRSPGEKQRIADEALARFAG